MLLRRMSSFPKITVGRTIAWLSPDPWIIRSIAALPRKYANGESSEGLVMLTCTSRRTPASFAAPIKVWVFRTARSNVTSPRGKRTQ